MRRDNHGFIYAGLFILLCMSSFVSAQITVTSPADEEIIRSAEDYAASSFQNHWDMQDRQDLGWWLYVDDDPKSYLTNISFTNGIFSAETTGNDPNISLLDSGVPGTCFLGKIGTNYPIDANKYKIIMWRMKLDSASNGQFVWSQDTIFNGVSISNAYLTYPYWNIYCVNLEDLGAAAGDSWSGIVDSLRMDPTINSNETIKIDWIRLVEWDETLVRNISWQGSDFVDIYLDNDNNSTNGHLGRIAKHVSGSSYSFYVGGLPCGTYYVGIRKSNTTDPLVYSSGRYVVNDIPVMKFDSPSEEGSPDDFATTQLNNAWDMDSLNDIDYYRNVQSLGIENISAEDDAGNDLGSVRVLKGLSEPANQGNVGDPNLYTLWWTERGATYTINSDRYRILVVDMGLPGIRNLVDGSEARIIWKNVGETGEFVSEDVVIRSKEGTPVLNKIIADLKSVPVESDPGGSYSYTGWAGMIDNFRIDPHEFSDPKEFYVKNIKIAAFETTDSSYLIEWRYSDAFSPSSSLSLYYDSDKQGFDGTQICSGIDPNTGSYNWNVSSLSEGTYYIYGVYSDGLNSNQCYARWPIVVDHAFQEKPTINLSRDRLNFGLWSDGTMITSPQEVGVNIVGDGQVNWSVSCNRDFIVLDPASGSGDGKFTVSIDPDSYWVGEYDGTITLTSGDASNSPQFVDVSMQVYTAGSTEKPIGYWDTPEDGATQVRGQIPVTGWALDDIEVERVEIWRRYEPEDPPEAQNDEGLVFVGEALFVEGARPNLETDPPYKDYPFSYKGGWGYMLLTYGLARRGNGTYVLHAFAWDVEGNRTDLGTKTITCDNDNAVKPFGTLDTPTPGMTYPDDNYGNISFGWALTPQPKKIPFDGSTIYVYIDGELKGNVDEYGNYSASVAEMFPGYANTDNAYGHYSIDLGSYENGVHTIQWSAYDSDGVVEGIGSRYFNIQNTGGAQAQEGSRVKNLGSVSGMTSLPDNSSGYLGVKRGYVDAKLQRIYPDENGVVKVEMEEADRVEIHLKDLMGNEALWGGSSGARHKGYLVVGQELRPLPIGSMLETDKGIFYWMPGAGFLGEYDFVFTSQSSLGQKEKTRVKVRILPKRFQ